MILFSVVADHLKPEPRENQPQLFLSRCGSQHEREQLRIGHQLWDLHETLEQRNYSAMAAMFFGQYKYEIEYEWFYNAARHPRSVSGVRESQPRLSRSRPANENPEIVERNDGEIGQLTTILRGDRFVSATNSAFCESHYVR